MLRKRPVVFRQEWKKVQQMSVKGKAGLFMQKLGERIWVGRLAVALTAAAVLMLTGTLVSLADESGDTTRFISDTKANGVDVGGLAVDEARTRTRGFYAGEYNLTIKERGRRQETIAGADIGYKVEVPKGPKAVPDVQNATGRVSEPDADNSRTMAVTMTYNQEAMGAKIKAPTLISGSGIIVTSDTRTPSYREEQPFSVIPAVQGNNVDEAKTAEVITAIMKVGQNSMNVDNAGRYCQVNIWKMDENLIASCTRMNQYRDMSVNYVFGDKREALGNETIAAWATGSRNGVSTVDLEKIAAFMTETASGRGAAGTARIFHTAAGKDVELTNPYGWKMDVIGGVRALIALIQVGPVAGPVGGEPVYAMTTVSHMAPDWGSTYAEAGLIGQHIYMSQEGNLVWDASYVTGNISKNYDTSAGIYSLTYEEKDRILRGVREMDGAYECESHVDYQMPFNRSTGFHDATWRSRLGGTIF